MSTTHYGLAKPSDGNTSWGAGYRAAMDTIDAQFGARPVYVFYDESWPDTTAIPAGVRVVWVQPDSEGPEPPTASGGTRPGRLEGDLVMLAQEEES
jgi:hypothetical protein